MTDPTDAQAFIDALGTLEQSGDAGPIAQLFAEGADVSNPLVKHPNEGEGGAHAFWTQYRAAFDTIRSEFRNVIEKDDVAFLEWTSEGEAKGGDVHYGGVSVLEFGDGGITAFRTYFDSAQIGKQLVAD